MDELINFNNFEVSSRAGLDSPEDGFVFFAGFTHKFVVELKLYLYLEGNVEEGSQVQDVFGIVGDFALFHFGGGGGQKSAWLMGRVMEFFPSWMSEPDLPKRHRPLGFGFQHSVVQSHADLKNLFLLGKSKNVLPSKHLAREARWGQ